MMARAAVVQSPTTDRLHSLHHKSPISKSRGLNENARWEKPGNISGIHALSGKPSNFARLSGKPKHFSHSWKPISNSHTESESRISIHTSRKQRNSPETPWKPTNYPHTSWEPKNSARPPWKSHTSGKPRSYTLTSWEPKNSARPPWKSHTSGKPRSYTLTSWEPSNFTSTSGKPENSTGISRKPRSVPDLYPLKTPTKKTDQQKEDSASIQEIRHPSKRRNSFGNVGMHQKESIHQEKNTEQTLKAKVRLDVMFEKENQNSECLNESIRTPTLVIEKSPIKKGKLSLNKSSMYLKCYTCREFVKDMHFEEHLFFGESECTQCNWKISSCEAFRENKIDQIMGNTTCLHTLRYCMTPSEYISNKISQESLLELDKSKLTSYVCSLNRLKATDPWKKAIDQCLKSFEGEACQPSQANGELLNASESETVFSVLEETVPTSKHEINNLPSITYEDSDLILSQSYNLEHLNDAVKFEIARDYPEVRMERSPVLFTESSTGSPPHHQTNVGTCSGSLIRDMASQSTSLSDGASQSTSLSDGASQSTSLPDGASQSTSLSDLASQSKSLSDVSSQSTSLSVVPSQSTSLSDGAFQSTSMFYMASQSTSWSDFSSQSTNLSDVSSQSTSLSDVTEVVGGLNGTEKRIIETPSNGHYLIVRHAVEECPMCYTEFCPSRFTVNINTFLLSTVCIGCDLTVYIIFDPPDGSAPKIFIETESGPPEKQKKRKPRVKDFFKR